MRPREVLRTIRSRGGKELYQTGSHLRCACACGASTTSVPMHPGDVRIGTLRRIEAHLAGCASFGKGWIWR